MPPRSDKKPVRPMDHPHFSQSALISNISLWQEEAIISASFWGKDDNGQLQSAADRPEIEQDWNGSRRWPTSLSPIQLPRTKPSRIHHRESNARSSQGAQPRSSHDNLHTLLRHPHIPPSSTPFVGPLAIPEEECNRPALCGSALTCARAATGASLR